MTDYEALLKEDETLTDLQIGQLKVLQKKQGFRFAIDAVLLAHFVRTKAGWQICDLGTGTGVIPLLLHARTAGLSIDAVELQPQMADMAHRSMLLNDLAHIRIHQADLKALPGSWSDRFDLITCNPPYFPVGCGKLNPLPEIALARHEIACTLEDIVLSAARVLKSNGRLCIIHRASRLAELLTLCQQHRLTPRRLRLVHPTAEDAANLVLVEAVKGAQPDLRVEAPLVIYTAPHQYSPEILHYYGGN